MRNIYANKLLIWIVGVALTAFLFWELNNQVQDDIDPYILLFIGVVKQVMVVFMLLFTRQWSWRAIGVMSVMQGVAIVYGGSAFFHWYPHQYEMWGEWTFDLGRSFLLVGSIPLLAGIVNYGWVKATGGDRRKRASSTNEALWGTTVVESKNHRDERQDTREDGLDERAMGLDKRGWDMSKESLAQERRSSKISDREDAQDIRDKEVT